jgi:hypothetical protein
VGNKVMAIWQYGYFYIDFSFMATGSERVKLGEADSTEI